MPGEWNSSQQGLVLITGASGGFGLHFALQLEAQGYVLILHGRDKTRLQMTLDALEFPERHQLMLGDLSSRKTLESLIDALVQMPIVGLVNNAGFGVWGGFEQRESVPQLDVLRTDLLAPVALAHALLPKLKKNHGFIINVSSLAGESPLPYMATYAAAKAGLTFWSEAIRAELLGSVRVVTLAPGPSPTGFRQISGAPQGKGSLFRIPAAQVVQSALRVLKGGGGYCVPGFRHHLIWMMQKIVPRSVSLAMMAYYLRR
ncbi:MAG: SDR family NAD(P)-dependent oxidoreductase [Zetaproteobacteria bacterium]|nr:SDR family NAD(P)-dependent oxidoreductase [Zetaproteobacteria bacterium]